VYSRVHEKDTAKVLMQPVTAHGSGRLHAGPLGGSRRTLRFPAAIFPAFCCVLLAFAIAFGSPSAMRAPDACPVRQKDSPDPETSFPRIVLLGAVTAYQKFISPTDGGRCGFYPSCSAFGRQAVSSNGVFPGVVLTADRLMRCNPFKRPGTFYLPLPDGRLYDPVENNLLSK